MGFCNGEKHGFVHLGGCGSGQDKLGTVALFSEVKMQKVNTGITVSTTSSS